MKLGYSIFSLLLLLVPSGYAAEPRPNIVVFFPYDMGWAQPGSSGGKLAPTPNMDSIAKNGVRFTNGYSSACVCSPGRVGVITGRYQARSGHDANLRRGDSLHLAETTMAQHLKQAGYTTGIVGKWHLGDGTPGFLPAARGFDFSIGAVGNLGEDKGPKFYRGDIQLDVLPTTLAAAGAELPKTELDGVNLLPLLEGKATNLEPRALYFRFGVQHAVRQGDWKLVKASKDMEPMLVNLATDPGEQHDLSSASPNKKAELTALFDK